MTKLTKKTLAQLDKQLEKRKKIHIDTSLGTFEVLINEIFSEIKIKKISNDIMELIKPLLESPDIHEEDLVAPVALIPILALREFTDLPIPKENDLATLAAVTEQLDAHGINRQVFSQFSVYEIDKLNKLVGNALSELPRFQQLVQELYMKYAIQQTNKQNETEGS